MHIDGKPRAPKSSSSIDVFILFKPIKKRARARQHSDRHPDHIEIPLLYRQPHSYWGLILELPELVIYSHDDDTQ